MANENPRPKQSLMGLIIAAAMIFGKSAKLIAVFKLLKFTKPLVTIISMLISAIVYGIWLGPWFGVGLVAMLFIHEMGHIIAFRIKGIETHGPMFIPFLGAVIFSPKYDDRDTEAFVGYGGPLLGTIGALACFAVWPFTEGKAADILLLVSYIGIFLNLFNLIPISPMDGGRITQAIGGWFKYVGIAILLIYTFLVREPGLLLIWLLILDGFDRMPLWGRPVVATALALMMAGLMLTGHSAQPWYVIAIDIVLASAFTFMFWIKDIARSEGAEDESVDNRPYPRGGVRAKWFVYYLAIVVVTSGTLWYQIDHMPHKVKTHSEQLTTPDVP